MSEERTGVITFQGNPMTLLGPEIEVGQQAADFTVLANDLSPVTLSDSKGRTRLISVVPSLDTGVCDMQTRRFNEEATRFPQVDVLTVSMDLPFAQARWCGQAGVERVQTLSDHRDVSFGLSYGLLIKELSLLTRAVLVVDADNVIRYIEIVPEVTDEPNFDVALEALSSLV